MPLKSAQGKEQLLDFYYGSSFSKVADKIHYVCKSEVNQLVFINKFLGEILKGELNPNQAKVTLDNSQLFDASQITVILSIISTDVLDPLKEALETVYSNQPNSVGGSIKKESVPSDNTEKPIKIQQTIISASQPVETISDPLDIFDKAKRDMGSKIGTQNIQENPIATKEMNANITTVETNQNVNSLRVNKAAILEDSSATNLKFQDNQSVERLSSLLKAKAETPNQEDLNLYVPTPEEKVDDLKPLNPIETGNDIDGLKESAQEEIINPVALPAALINSAATEPKSSTMAENIAQSHLKFAQSEQQGISAEKSYSKLLGAMAMKPKNQPPIVGKLKETFEHPERYTVAQEPSRPKPRKYAVSNKDSSNISVISSKEQSSNISTNAIMQEEVEDDIINLAKNISKKIDVPASSEEPQGPIVYSKQVPKTNDPFASVTLDKKDSSNKNSNIIDLS
ncbi:MAG: hypothetical protein WAW33_01480 [Minisyncoccia bacterium]